MARRQGTLGVGLLMDVALELPRWPRKQGTLGVGLLMDVTQELEENINILAQKRPISPPLQRRLKGSVG